MTSEQDTHQKSRFPKSREVQEEFVNGIAEAMVSLGEKAGQWERGWSSIALGLPFCPVTGREYSGANMIRLLLAGFINGYEDDRWMTFKQLQDFQKEHPELRMNIRKGEHGIKLLRPEECSFLVDEHKKWILLSREEIKQLTEREAQGEEIPEIKHMVLFRAFTVFNAEQIDGFPAKERPTSFCTKVERNEFVERFIACSGVPVKHFAGEPCYSLVDDEVKLPYPQNFFSPDEYYAAKLHEFFHATGHHSRENRALAASENLKERAYEEMRAELFSMLAGMWLHLPMPTDNSAAYIRYWNQKFSGGDAKAVFQAAGEASKILALLHQFEMGEQPAASWFPLKEHWPELMEAQNQRDANPHITFTQEETPAAAMPEGELVFAKSAESTESTPVVNAFQNTDDLVTQVRWILRNPEFLDLALQQDPDSVMELAELCDSLSRVFHMEVEEKRRLAARIAPDESRMSLYSTDFLGRPRPLQFKKIEGKWHYMRRKGAPQPVDEFCHNFLEKRWVQGDMADRKRKTSLPTSSASGTETTGEVQPSLPRMKM